MNIPLYWSKATVQAPDASGRPRNYSAWRWSNESLADANRQAQAAAAQMARRVAAGHDLETYPYGVRPMREQVVDRIARENRELGVLTRNGYGALVLNAANAMFIDIDFPKQESSSGLAGGLKKLFGGAPPASPEAQTLKMLERWATSNPGLGLRAYRTAGGMRALVTSVTFDPALSQTQQILRGLGSDPLYIQLCQAQQCFRARLTPKPWRIGLHMPPSRWPFERPDLEARYRQWENIYTQKSASFSTVRLLKSFGSPGIHPDIAPILDLHDRLALNSPSAALA